MANKNQLKLDFKNKPSSANKPSAPTTLKKNVKVIDISNRSAIYKRIIGRTN